MLHKVSWVTKNTFSVISCASVPAYPPRFCARRRVSAGVRVCSERGSRGAGGARGGGCDGALSPTHRLAFPPALSVKTPSPHYGNQEGCNHRCNSPLLWRHSVTERNLKSLTKSCFLHSGYRYSESSLLLVFFPPFLALNQTIGHPSIFISMSQWPCFHISADFRWQNYHFVNWVTSF